MPDYSEDKQALFAMLDELNISYTTHENQTSITYELLYDGDFSPIGYEEYGNVRSIGFQCVYSSNPRWQWDIGFSLQSWGYISTGWDLHREYDTIDRDVFSKDIELATKEYVDNLPTSGIEVNVEEEATDTLENVKVGDVVYKVEGGDAVLHVEEMPITFEDKVYVHSGGTQVKEELLTLTMIYSTTFPTAKFEEDIAKIDAICDKFGVTYTITEEGTNVRNVNFSYDGLFTLSKPEYYVDMPIKYLEFTRVNTSEWYWILHIGTTRVYTKEFNDKVYLAYKKETEAQVYASEVELATKEALDIVEEEIDSINLKAAMAVDEKPVYNEADGTISYIQNGVAGTTDNTDQWFYYVEDDQMYQTIWIGGIEKTILSAGEEVDALRVKLTKADDTKKSLQLMYEDGELGGGAISMTKAEWEVYDKDSLDDKAEIIITDDVEDGGEAAKDVYSTDEIKTNKVWIDDKPIYRKVIQVNGAMSSKFPMVIPDVENVEKFEAYVEWNSNTRNMSQLCMKPDNTIVPPLLYKIESSGLSISIMSGSIANYYMSQVVVEYTKK